MKRITEYLNENYDQLGNDLKIGDRVIFYYENGVESKEDKTKTPRLYRGILKSWDEKKLEGNIETMEYDRYHYDVPNNVIVGQRLMIKYTGNW